MDDTTGPVWVRLENIALPLEDGDNPHTALTAAVARKLGLGRNTITQLSVAQRAIDARRQAPRFSYMVDVALAANTARRVLDAGLARPRPMLRPHALRLRRPVDGPRPVVVGAGPAGLFAAWTLAEAGWAPILIERGHPVRRRSKDVSRLYAHGELHPDSNVCYGEGGAGTYSDGKLYTRVGDARIDEIMHQLVAMGAPARILTDHRPHVGTDKLVGILEALRARLIDLGVTFRFESVVENFEHTQGVLTGFMLRGGERIDARHAVLATGHSARHIWDRLLEAGVPLQARPFAMGFRVEHPQALINEARYGAQVAAQQVLPAADYKLTYNEPADNASGRRGVFSFCMCPGGVVVTTPTEPEKLCINGMSHASRQGKFANSAMVVSVDPKDFAEAGYTGTFAGLALQDAVEGRAYRAGGSAFVAPAARVADFVAGKTSSSLPHTSYRRGIVPADLGTLYPTKITQALRRALQRFERTLPGFVSQEATLIGVETRTAAPVRVPRDEGGEAVGLRGLYPAGEGMGYGGGIMSAAVDGVRAAEAMLRAVGALEEPQAQRSPVPLVAPAPAG